VAELRPRAEEFSRKGATLAVIGNGWPQMAKAFAERTGFPPSVRVLTDPTRRAFEAAGLLRSRWRTLFDPQALVRWLRARRKGFRQGRTQGDAWQQGGSLVVLPGGRVAFRYVSSAPGDHPSPDALLAALP
jgi:hypothetical protein